MGQVRSTGRRLDTTALECSLLSCFKNLGYLNARKKSSWILHYICKNTADTKFECIYHVLKWYITNYVTPMAYGLSWKTLGSNRIGSYRYPYITGQGYFILHVYGTLVELCIYLPTNTIHVQPIHYYIYVYLLRGRCIVIIFAQWWQRFVVHYRISITMAHYHVMMSVI